jgi:hypothetical protein
MRSIARFLVAIAACTLAVAARGQDTVSPPSHRPKARFTVPPGATIAPRRESVFGTADTSYYRVGAVEFDPDTDFVEYNSTWEPPGTTDYRRYVQTTAISWLFAVPHLPGGALLTTLELDDCDTNTEGNHLVLELWDCDYLGACGAAPIASVSSANNEQGFQCGFASVDLSAMGYTVDNVSRLLLLYANLPARDATNQLAGAMIGYKLQVSPPPATATFNDVPTDHPQFQFIEALAASGITAGCGAGNFCPNSPLTRGQMAVFLSKALGLHWANH